MPPPHHRAPHPPPHGPRHGHAPRAGVPASRVLDFVDDGAVSDWLRTLVPDDGDRAFVVRCLVGEGPIHHRGANFILLALLARALAERGGPKPPAAGVRVPMRLPPHLADEVDDGAYPLALPTGALRELARGDPAQLDAMIDCLTDGPPQHALANVAMVALIESLLAERPAPAP